MAPTLFLVGPGLPLKVLLDTCDVAVANSNHKHFSIFFTCTCALHFEKGSATHVTYVFPCIGICPNTSYLQERLA